MSGYRYAFSLSKDKVANSQPPGTEKLIEHELARTQSGTTYQDDHIRLVPTPSKSPRDPLNWPKWRKNAILFAVSLYAASATISAAMVAPSLPVLRFQLLPPKSLNTLSHLVSVNVLLNGVCNIVVVPLANVFGRRLVVTLSLLIATLASVWAGTATSFSSLLAARAIQGFGFAASDTVAPDVLGEIFFLHERGRAMAIYTACLGGGSFVGGVAGGFIASNLGYRYIFWISTAILGFTLVCQILLVPETLFNRDAITIQTAVHDSDGDESKEPNTTNHEELTEEEKALTFLESLRMGVYRGGVLRQFLAPWYSLLFPGTWVVLLHYGGLLGGMITMVTMAPIFLSEPPYLWGKNVGLINVAGLVGTLLGATATYFMADRLTKALAQRKVTGLAEPETRLVAIFPGLFFATTGNWVFGFSANHPSPHAWAGMAVGLGMVAFALIGVPSIGFNYLIDAYFAISNDCFVMTSISRAVVSFVWTFFVTDWVLSVGAATPFGIFGMIMGIFSLLTVPLLVYGKRMRIATAKWLPTELNH